MLDSLVKMKRTHWCGELTLQDAGREVVLMGWVHRIRDLGGLFFLDLRDREGITQVVFNPREDPSLHARGQSLGREYVIGVKGKVVKRPEGTSNPDLTTGEIEVHARDLAILNTSAPLPLARLDEEGEKFLPNEDLRLKYRYLDLRRKKMYENLRLRHRVTKAVRDFFDREGFLEVETPMLIKSTPEGARDYLVPSRVFPGKFFALPQSPQIFKQILMVAGIDRYVQIARCFRDEDLRADRQPEFVQVDVEMSFVEQGDLLALIEAMVAYLFQETLGVSLRLPFPRLSYQKAMDLYGSDKPDLRWDLPISDLTDFFKVSDFRIFKEAVDGGGLVRGIVAPGGKKMASRKDLDSLSEWVVSQGGKGAVSLIKSGEEIKSSLTRSLTQEHVAQLVSRLGVKDGDHAFFLADRPGVIEELMGRLRLELIRRFQVPPQEKQAFLWVTEFPLFSHNEEERRLDPVHHPFTSPLPEDVAILDQTAGSFFSTVSSSLYRTVSLSGSQQAAGDVSRDRRSLLAEILKEQSVRDRLLSVRAAAHDLVMNGVELGGGSMRIYQRPLQEKIFALIGLTEAQAREKFGFMLEAFEYGAPPHGGIALGMDRLVMLMAGAETIREVIAFPKNQSAVCLLSGAPMEVAQDQLDLLGISLKSLK